MTRYIVNTDGGSRGNPGPAGFGFVVTDEGGRVLYERAGFLGRATNNVAEYMAVVVALEEIAAATPAARVTVRADSKLVVEQLSGRWKIKNAELQQLALRAKRALRPAQVRYQWVPRAENAAADALANRAMDTSADVTKGRLPSSGSDDDTAHLSGDVTRRSGEVPLEGGPAVVEETEPDDAAHITPDPAPGPEETRRVVRPREGAPLTLVFLRHGETTMTQAGAHSGGTEPGPPLSPRGRRQAAAAANILARLPQLWEDIAAPVAVWNSPMVRTRETAGVVGDALGIAPRVVDDLREGDFGAWQGLTRREIHAGWPGVLERWHHEVEVQPPGGESLAQVAARVREVVGEALARHAGETVVFVGHSIVTKTGIGTVTGMDTATWYDLRIPPGSLSIVRLWPESHELVLLGLPPEVLEPDATPTLF